MTKDYMTEDYMTKLLARVTRDARGVWMQGFILMYIRVCVCACVYTYIYLHKT
jgi:hypothetical protein